MQAEMFCTVPIKPLPVAIRGPGTAVRLSPAGAAGPVNQQHLSDPLRRVERKFILKFTHISIRMFSGALIYGDFMSVSGPIK